jgi:hypothetical protein
MSTLLAMMAQLTATPADVRKPTMTPEPSLKIASSDGETASANTGQAATSNAAAISNSPAGALASLLDPKSQPAKAAGDGTGKVLPEDRKPASTVANAPPADIALARKEAGGIEVTPTGPAPQPVVDNALATQLAVQNPIRPADGTGTALNGQRMKSTVDKTEIAGSKVQKLPSADPGTVASARAAGSLDPESDSNSALPKTTIFDPAMAMDFVAKLGSLDFEQSGGMSSPQPLDQAAAQVERVAQMVNQEVLSLRQSGASTLAVSLKVDAHTELFLQVSNHNGQIAASIRCERGNLNGLDGHWGDLQESLARQNVQLLPLEVKASANTSSFDSANQNQPREARELPQATTAPAAAKAVAANKPKTKTNSRRGWESWA